MSLDLTTVAFCSAGDAVDFMTWFLNALHGALGGTKKKTCKQTAIYANNAIIRQVFGTFNIIPKQNV